MEEMKTSGHLGGGGVTWATQVQVLVLVVGAAPQAPGVVGQGEQVLQPRRSAYGTVEAPQPLLALLEGGEVAPEGRAGNRRKKMMNF